MYYERLSLEITAAKSHWQVVNPPTVSGRSGVTHRFDFLALSGHEKLAFDICQTLTETEVIKTFIKKLDTGVSAYIICLSETMPGRAARLAEEYGLKILRSDDLESAFVPKGLEQRSRGQRLAAA